MIQYLDWDSQFFNAKIGKVICDSHFSIENIWGEKQAKGYDRIYLFSKTKLKSYHPSLLLVDEKVTFSMKVKPKKKKPEYCNIYDGDINEELLKLSLLSGHKSRFKSDPFFKPQFRQFYTLWLQNSLNKSFADEVIVASIEKHIAGFVTLKKESNSGSIGLIAVNDQYQGKGIGKDLLLAANNWFIENQIQFSEVVTQIDNTKACIFYKSFGYHQKKIEYIYHL